MAEKEYEKLRPTNRAVGGNAFRWGRALLIERGMAAWLEVVSTSSAAALREGERDAEAPGEASLAAEASLSPQAYREAIDVVSELVSVLL